MNKKIVLIIAVFLFMALGSLFTVSKTHAHWSDIDLSALVSSNLVIGEWDLILEWDPNATYSNGDIVENNGVLYQARVDNPDREPGVSPGWRSQWNQL